MKLVRTEIVERYVEDDFVVTPDLLDYINKSLTSFKFYDDNLPVVMTDKQVFDLIECGDIINLYKREILSDDAPWILQLGEEILDLVDNYLFAHKRYKYLGDKTTYTLRNVVI